MRRDFTANAERALNKAGEVAAKMGMTAIGTEHLLYGLMAVSGTASRILKENGIKKSVMLQALQDLSAGRGVENVVQSDCDITPRLEETVLAAEQIADKNEDEKIGTEHLFLGMPLNPGIPVHLLF